MYSSRRPRGFEMRSNILRVVMSKQRLHLVIYLLQPRAHITTPVHLSTSSYGLSFPRHVAGTRGYPVDCTSLPPLSSFHDRAGSLGVAAVFCHVASLIARIPPGLTVLERLR
ncbi:hypothetical protein PLICRDRAFT_464180 [Plicaturopsis crispa FD-325 SS-3]|nr:hypothetical protein PLICRDRAFT_464180 [Plicaturopsis crispa FD-325 SS-3]